MPEKSKESNRRKGKCYLLFGSSSVSQCFSGIQLYWMPSFPINQSGSVNTQSQEPTFMAFSLCSLLYYKLENLVFKIIEACLFMPEKQIASHWIVLLAVRATYHDPNQGLLGILNHLGYPGSRFTLFVVNFSRL